jgi:hypothetical protein
MVYLDDVKWQYYKGYYKIVYLLQYSMSSLLPEVQIALADNAFMIHRPIIYVYILHSQKHIRPPQFYNKNYILDKYMSIVHVCTRRSNICYLHSHQKIMLQDNTFVKRIFSYLYRFLVSRF